MMGARRARPDGAWKVFVILGALMGAHAGYLMVLPSADPEHWREYTTDPRVLAYLGDEFRSAGGVQLGFAIFSVIVTVRWFRAGDPWAWAVLWVYPLLFAWQAVTTWATGLFVVLYVVALVALMVSRPRWRFGTDTAAS